jgi:hypothetical protein
MELVGERGEQMECQACGHYETTFHPEFVRLRDLQVRVLTGSSIRDWKAKAQQLSPRFHHRWGSTLQYLDPATSAAISRMDDLARVYAAQIPYDDELFLIRGKAARRLFQSHLEANPTLSPVGDDERAYVDDWF